MASATFAPFQYRTYRMLWIASLVTNLGGMIQGVGAGWLMASLTPNPAMVSLVQGSITLPLALLSLLGGVFADNYERRTVMLAAQTFMLLTSAALAGLAWAGMIGPWGLLAFTFAIGCGAAMHLPSWQASVGDLVPREHLPQAVMLNGMGFNLMRSAGPAVGGLVVAALGAAAAFAINAITYVPVIFALAGWKPTREPDPLPREPLGSALRAGLRYASLSADHLKILIRGSAFGFAAVSILALMPIVARDLLQGTALTFGMMLTCFGMGAVLVALTLRRVRARFQNETIVRTAFLGLALGLFGVSQSTNVVATGAAAFLTGIAWQSAMSLLNVATQLSTPRWVLGRVMSMFQVFTFGGMTLGSYVWGRVAEAGGVGVALQCAAIACLAGAAIGLVMRLPAERQGNLDPHGRFRVPDVELDIDMESGPIKVSVEFVIPVAKTDTFLELMAHRRVIRLRDGAHSWSLYRDLAQPDLWHETYRVPTWAAYLRHMARRTTTDAENYDRLLALHTGETPPLARRWIERPADPEHAHAKSHRA
ncbi:putative MFS family arabinose efflux permease [Aliiruegeria haliotis]|uniref:Putative MFS family arabinose efflux permease n=1 Tax=Aliiruegeria haliotis TaxID=1280846 RepID=A0A2T0RXY5_9RHOB|nr:MFS transporter [Aliiruegeria haliotis]PRY26049.1 putative MFS family arabinose efflux permease [Aliiruegeria haliotis]